MKTIVSLAAASLFAIGLSAQAQAKTYKIGVAGPHTGPNAAFGKQLWMGAQQAAKDIKKSHGITLDMVKADDACEPKQAVTVANRLVSKDRVDAVIGHFCSSSTLPASEVYDEAGILMVTPASTSTKVTEQNMPTILRTCGRDDQQGGVAASFISKDLKAKKVAVVHDKDTYGKGLADATMADLKKFKTPVVLYEGLTRGEKDFNALVTKIKSSGADVVYFGGLHAEAGLLVRQMRDQDVKADFVSGDGIVSDEFLVAVGSKKNAKGVYFTFGKDPSVTPAGKALVERFQKEAKYNAEGYTLYSYATVQAIAAALKANPSAKGKDLADWLKKQVKTPVKTVMGPKAWDSKGDLIVSDYVIYQWDGKGKYAQLKM